MWVYAAIHGSYGILWLLKHFVHPDPSFEVYVSLTAAISGWISLLGPYCFASFAIASRMSVNGQTPGPERIFIAVSMYCIGLVLMFGTDG